MSDEFDRELEKLEAQLRVVLRDLEEANARLREKPEELLFARCAKHIAVPQLNEAESSGAECGACAAEKATRLAKEALCPRCGKLRAVDLRKEFRCPRCGELQRNDGQFYPLEVGFMQAGGTLLCFACREWCRTQNHGDGTMAQA